MDPNTDTDTVGVQETLQEPLHNDVENCSLQDAFKAFREKRQVRTLPLSSDRRAMISIALQNELRDRSRAQAAAREQQRDQATMDSLREKFLQTALSYCGVPYARRYHQPECESCNGCQTSCIKDVPLPLHSPHLSCPSVPRLLWSGQKGAT